MKNIDHIIKFLDENFYKEKVVNNNGTLGAHYYGLTFDYYFQESILYFDFGFIDTYFIKTINFEYDEEKTLANQLTNKDLNIQIKVIQQILNIFHKTSFEKENVQNKLSHINNMLLVEGINIFYVNDQIILELEKIKFGGTYCDIIEIDNGIYKKRLNKQHANLEQWQKRMKIEFKNMNKLKESPYILKVFEFDEIEHSYLMEACECDLYDYLYENVSISIKEKLNIIKDILYGMNDAHMAGIIHRDLHLANIFKKDGHFIIADFGLSKDTHSKNSLKTSSTPKNNHSFMDPLGRSSFKLLDKLSDIYSIGKIIEYIAGDSQLGNDLDSIIKKCTNRNRNDRYQNISDIIKDFDTLNFLK